MGKRIAILALCCFCVVANASVTLLSRELFGSISTSTNVVPISVTNVDQFASVYSNLTVIASGVKVTNSLGNGWTGLVTNKAYGTWNGTATGYVCGWFCFTSYGNNPSSASELFWVHTGSGDFGIVGISPNGAIWVGGRTNSTSLIPLYTWEFIGIAWNQRASDHKMDLKVYVSTNLSILNASTNEASYSDIQTVNVGAGQTSSRWSGKMSGLSFYAITDWSDVMVPSDLTVPESRAVWYWNYQTGSDSNDGRSSTTAFQSSQLLNRYLYYGFFAANTANPWQYVAGGDVATNLDPSLFVAGITNGTIRSNADRILIDTSAGAFPCNYSIVFAAQNSGLELTSANAGPAIITPMLQMTGSTQYDAVNFPNVWIFTNAVDARAVLWEDRRWMNNPIGANITAVRTNLNTTDGSFFTSGTTLYFSPFEHGVDPNATTNIYEVSRKLKDYTDTPQYGSVINTSANDTFIHNFSAGGVTFRNSSSGACDAVYVVQATGGGRSVLGDSHLFYGSNHSYGATDGPTNLFRLLYRSKIEQGPPWSPNSAGYTSTVEFTPSTNAAPREMYYADVDFSIDSLIGSSTGTNYLGLSPGTVGFTSHGNGGTNQFVYSKMTMDRVTGSCGFGIASNVLIRSSLLDAVSMVQTTIENSTIHGTLAGSGTNLIRNCLLVPSLLIPFTANSVAYGAMGFENCTFDVASAPLQTYFKSASVTTNVLLLTNRNNVFLAAMPVFRTKTNDVIVSDHNAVVMIGQANFYYNGNYGTWSQWKTEWSADANSITNTSACLGPGYRPYTKTPCWNAGEELGPATDFTGKLFQSRRTAGAYEYVTPQPTLLMFHR